MGFGPDVAARTRSRPSSTPSRARIRPGGGCWTRTLKAAFDRIDHHHLLAQLGGFPASEQVEDWLTAGVVEWGLFTPTEEGTPQGGVVSPLLLNVALHGMEHAAGVRYRTVTTDGAVTAPRRSGRLQCWVMGFV